MSNTDGFAAFDQHLELLATAGPRVIEDFRATIAEAEAEAQVVVDDPGYDDTHDRGRWEATAETRARTAALREAQWEAMQTW